MFPVFHISLSLDSLHFAVPTESGEGNSSDPLVWGLPMWLVSVLQRMMLLTPQGRLNNTSPDTHVLICQTCDLLIIW